MINTGPSIIFQNIWHLKTWKRNNDQMHFEKWENHQKMLFTTDNVIEQDIIFKKWKAHADFIHVSVLERIAKEIQSISQSIKLSFVLQP